MNRGIGIGKRKGNKLKKLLLLLLLNSVFYTQDFRGVDYVINEGIKDKIIPGGAVAIGTPDKILYTNYFGGFTYDADSKRVDKNTLYDMASVTKVMATTLCVMKLYDERKISLDDKVAKFLPEFAENDKGDVTLKNLLLHNSGLPAYYSPKGESRDELFKKIFSLPKVYKTGEKMVYSCLNFITLMKVVEAVTGDMMYKFYAENITGPLGLKNSMFKPPVERVKDCAPTENGLQGKVHDPLANALEGYSGNAGLFSNAEDMSVLATMMLNKGIYKGTRIFKETTVKLFTTPGDPNSTRGLGWDTNVHGDKSCGPLFSKTSFGHTGYTGPCVWMDPERKIYVIFLNNRVYPDDESSVGGLRIKLHNTIIKAMENIPPAPTVISFYESAKGKIHVSVDANQAKGKIISTKLYLNGTVIKEVPATNDMISYVFDKSGNNDVFYAVNKNDERESLPSDKYFIQGKFKDLLIVDGIKSDPTKDTPYYDSFIKFSEGLKKISSAMVCNQNDVTNGTIKLNEYPIVYWACGEDNNANSIFNKEERKIVVNYLNSGGRVILAGSEIGWAFGRPQNGEEQNNFYELVLGAKFEGDNAETHEIIAGINGKHFNFSTETALYHVGYPDYFSPLKGSREIFQYPDGKGAALIKHFENGGALVYFGIPLEVISSGKEIQEVLSIVLSEMDR